MAWQSFESTPAPFAPQKRQALSMTLIVHFSRSPLRAVEDA